MELMTLAVIAAFLSSGIYMLLDRTLLRVVIGAGLLSNGTNLLLLATGGLERGAAPIVPHGNHGAVLITDPLPQALILTAIVIGFGVTALLLTLAYRTNQSQGSDDLRLLHGKLPDE